MNLGAFRKFIGSAFIGLMLFLWHLTCLMYPLYDRFNDNIEVDRLHQAIAQLPEKQRRRLVLYYFGEFTYEQIADMEGCKHPAVMKSISSALKKLKNFLSGEVTI